MKNDRARARTIGILYIVGTIAGVTSALIMPAFPAGTDVLAQVAAHRSQMIAAALLVLTMCFSLSALAAVFHPIGRRYSEALSMGYVIFRGALEAWTYLMTAFIWLVLVALSAEPSAAASMAVLLQTAGRVISEQLGTLPFVVGAFMFSWLLFRFRLVPRWLSVWGVVGTVLYLAPPLGRMAGLSIDFLYAPLALQEMVLAVWLIARGFNPRAENTEVRDV